MKQTYNDLVKENGFLTEYGSKLVDEKLIPVIREFVSEMNTENEMRVVGSILSNVVGKETANLIQHFNENENIVKQIKQIKASMNEGLKSFIGKENTKETQKEIKDGIEKTIEVGGFLLDPFELDWPFDIKK